MKPLVIYHADCTDGFAAAFAAWLKLGDEAEYLPMAYNACWTDGDECAVDVQCQERDVYILDFSFCRSIMDQIFASASRIVWLDHHKTAFEMYVGSDYLTARRTTYIHHDATDESYTRLDNNKSGALLAWEYFHPNTEVPMLIKHIDDRDRWQFKLDGSKELHAALSSMKPWSFEQWKVFLYSANLPENSLIIQGRAILRAQDAHVKGMLKQARKCMVKYDTQEHLPTQEAPWRGGHVEIKGVRVVNHKFPGLALNTNMHQSEVGHELANQSGTYGLVWYVGADNRVRCSLRSNGDYDVSAIAKAFGGGGHRNAAGFETDISTLMGWL